MRKPFEQWAEQEITRLRTEADALERALRKYVESEEKSFSPNLHPMESGEVGALESRPRVGRRKGSKTSAILDFVRNEGARGATLHDVYEFAGNKHVGMSHNSIRSVLWFAKKQGSLTMRGERYYFREEGPSSAEPGPS